MLKISMLLVALGIAGGIVLWSRSPSVIGSPTATKMSIQEIHALAHQENLPVQEFEDQSLVYPTVATANAQHCLKTVCPKGQQATHFIDQDVAGVAIKGYDPVAYFTIGHPVKGGPDIEYVWKDAHWRFSTQEDRDAFIKDPDKFSPQYGGYCAFGVSVNVLADIDPEAWAIMDEKLYLFHRLASLDKFKTATAENISNANANWSVLQPKK